MARRAFDGDGLLNLEAIVMNTHLHEVGPLILLPPFIPGVHQALHNPVTRRDNILHRYENTVLLSNQFSRGKFRGWGGGGREVVEMSEKGKDGSNGADIATRKELKRASTGAVEEV